MLLTSCRFPEPGYTVSTQTDERATSSPILMPWQIFKSGQGYSIGHFLRISLQKLALHPSHGLSDGSPWMPLFVLPISLPGLFSLKKYLTVIINLSFKEHLSSQVSLCSLICLHSLIHSPSKYSRARAMGRYHMRS